MRTTFAPDPVVRPSSTKLPASVWFKIESWTPVASTRTYGPAGRLRAVVVPATVTVSSTAEPRVLTRSLIVPEPWTSEASAEANAAVTSSDPPTPADDSTSSPDPLVKLARVEAPSPRTSEALVDAIVTRRSPVVEVFDSIANDPESVWPPAVSVWLGALKRRYGPPGSPIRVPAAVLMLRAYWPERATPLTWLCRANEPVAANPAVPTWIVAVPPVRETSGFAPSLRVAWSAVPVIWTFGPEVWAVNWPEIVWPRTETLPPNEIGPGDRPSRNAKNPSCWAGVEPAIVAPPPTCWTVRL